MPNEQEMKFIDAVKQGKLEAVAQLLDSKDDAEKVDVNIPSLEGIPLYLATKQRDVAMVKCLVGHKADINQTQVDVDLSIRPGEPPVYKVYSAIDYAAADYKKTSDNKSLEIFKYLLGKRTYFSADTLDKMFDFCHAHYNKNRSFNNRFLFDYVVSSLTRFAFYGIFFGDMQTQSLTLLAAITNIDKGEFDKTSLCDGGTHESMLVFRIRVLFEWVFKLKYNVESLGEAEVGIPKNRVIERLHKELLLQLEVFVLHQDVSRVTDLPMPQRPVCYEAIAANLVQKMSQLQKDDEYTLAVGWQGHAVCINMMRQVATLAIRVDNLNPAEKSEHEVTKVDNQLQGIRPRIIGEIPIETLTDNCSYLQNLLELVTIDNQASVSRDEGMTRVYQNPHLKHCQESKLEFELTAYPKQASANCFVKAHEPGVSIRLNSRECPKLFAEFRAQEMALIGVLTVKEKLEEGQREYKPREYWATYTKWKELLKPAPMFSLDDSLKGVDEEYQSVQEGTVKEIKSMEELAETKDRLLVINFRNKNYGDKIVDRLMVCLNKKHFVRIDSIDLSYNGLTSSSIKILAKYLNIWSILCLRLKGNPIGDEGAEAIAELLKNNQHLRLLDLRGVHYPQKGKQISAIGAKHLAQGLAQNKSVQVLDLWGNCVGDEGMKSLMEALKGNKSIFFLGLGRNAITGLGAEHLRLLRARAAPVSLDLRYNAMGTHIATIKAVLADETIPLIGLNLTCNYISESGIKELLPVLEGNRSLLYVSFYSGDMGDDFYSFFTTGKSYVWQDLAEAGFGTSLWLITDFFSNREKNHNFPMTKQDRGKIHDTLVSNLDHVLTALNRDEMECIKKAMKVVKEEFYAKRLLEGVSSRNALVCALFVTHYVAEDIFKVIARKKSQVNTRQQQSEISVPLAPSP